MSETSRVEASLSPGFLALGVLQHDPAVPPASGQWGQYRLGAALAGLPLGGISLGVIEYQ